MRLCICLVAVINTEGNTALTQTQSEPDPPAHQDQGLLVENTYIQIHAVSIPLAAGTRHPVCPVAGHVQSRKPLTQENIWRRS